MPKVQPVQDITLPSSHDIIAAKRQRELARQQADYIPLNTTAGLCVCVYAYVYMYVCTHACMYVYIYVYACMY